MLDLLLHVTVNYYLKQGLVLRAKFVLPCNYYQSVQLARCRYVALLSIETQSAYLRGGPRKSFKSNSTFTWLRNDVHVH